MLNACPYELLRWELPLENMIIEIREPVPARYRDSGRGRGRERNSERDGYGDRHRQTKTEIETVVYISSYVEVRRIKVRKKVFLLLTVSEDMWRYGLEPEREKKYRYIMSMPSYRSRYEKWNFSVNLRELGAGEISYLYTYELK